MAHRFALAVSLVMLASSAYAQKAVHVVIPPLKTDVSKAAEEIKRQFARKPKEVSVVEKEAAEFTVEVVNVTKRSAGQTMNGVVPGQRDERMVSVVTAKLCMPAKDYCTDLEGDSSGQAIQVDAVGWAADRVEEKIRKAIK